jgi:hypothetical protein
MKKGNYDQIISELKKELDSECAIASKYGIVLATKIKEFSKAKIIPQKILSVIKNSQDIAKELGLKQINSFALEAEKYNYLFTFSSELILISKLKLDVNLSKFMPNVSAFLNKLSENLKEDEIKEFSEFDFKKEIQNIEESIKKDESKDKKYSIIKDLVSFISN